MLAKATGMEVCASVIVGPSEEAAAEGVGGRGSSEERYCSGERVESGTAEWVGSGTVAERAGIGTAAGGSGRQRGEPGSEVEA